VLLEVREFPKKWEDAETGQRITVGGDVGEAVVTGLHPTATYEFRITALGPDGAVIAGPGRAVACDTLAAGCVPKEGEADGKKGKGGGCAVQ
jgi:hypothetical protein